MIVTAIYDAIFWQIYSHRRIKLQRIIIVVLLLGGDLAETCCVRKNVPSECHFLCGSGSAGFFVKWKCRAKYYATIKTCQVNDAIGTINLWYNATHVWNILKGHCHDAFYSFHFEF